MIVVDLLPPANLILKKLLHPKIARFYGFSGSTEVPVYIITELMKHNSLAEYLHGERRLTY
jgi:serine/threonine protein kinase